jgi:hypothetical protein
MLTIENIISLASLIIALSMFYYGIKTSRNNVKQQALINEALRAEWEKSLHRWQEEKDGIDVEQWKEIEKITNHIQNIQIEMGKEKGRNELELQNIKHSINNHSQMFLEISSTLKELPIAISNQITKEINSLKELFEEKIENLKNTRRVTK